MTRKKTAGILFFSLGVDSMSMVAAKAALILADVQATNSVSNATLSGGDLLTTIISIVQSLLGSFGACGATPAQVHAAFTNPNMIQSLTLKSTTRRELRRAGMPSALEYPITQSTTKVGASLQPNETAAMLAEVA
jgi:hypothetical protein